jgi:hypothetical protein
VKRPNRDYSPRVIKGKLATNPTERVHPYNLVEPMQFLFERIVKARGLVHHESPYVRIRTSSAYVRSKSGTHRLGEPTDSPEWHQVFAIGLNRLDAVGETLEISVWDSPTINSLAASAWTSLTCSNETSRIVH